MKSQMTEREFMERFAKIYGAEYTGSNLRELVAAVAREAGLEFAPEPSKLPERIANVRDQTSEGNGLWPAESFHASYPREFWNLLYDEAVARYNAYPSLWRAAEVLAAALAARDHPGITWHENIRHAYDDLRAALVESPKP